jgi:hypothetical protein
VALLGPDFCGTVTGVSIGSKFVSDAELHQIGHLTQLEDLRIFGPRPTNTGLSNLEKLVMLRDLTLDTPGIDDNGLIHLRGLTKLQTLFIMHTPVSDRGLVHLHELRNLRSVVLLGTRVTEEGRRSLQRALPDAKVECVTIGLDFSPFR